MGQSIQYSRIGKVNFVQDRPLKNQKAEENLKFFKGCLPQILLGPFLNTLSQIMGKY